MSEDIRYVIARSSLGGYAWCFNCHHPDQAHRSNGTGPCIIDAPCDCPGLRRMTPDEWLAWKHPELIEGGRR